MQHRTNQISNVFGDNPRTNLLYEIFKLTKQDKPIYREKLVSLTGYTAQTIFTHTKELEKDGIISFEKGEGSNTKYIKLNPKIFDKLAAFLWDEEEYDRHN